MAVFKGLSQQALENNRVGLLGTEGNLSFKKEEWVLPAGQVIAKDDTLESKALLFQPDSQILLWELYTIGDNMAADDDLEVDIRRQSLGGTLGEWAPTNQNFLYTSAQVFRSFLHPKANDRVFFSEGRGVSAINPRAGQEEKYAREYRIRAANPIAAGRRTLVSLIFYGNV